MSARKRDVVRAEQEGVCICFEAQPVKIFSDHMGRVSQVVYRHFAPDAQHNAVSIRYSALENALEKSETCIDADLVIAAYERVPDMGCLHGGEDAVIGFKSTRTGTLAADGITHQAAPNIFTAGDMHTGRASVIGAVAGGRMAARSIHHVITSGQIPVPENLHRRINPKSIIKDIRVSAGSPKVMLREQTVAARRKSFTEEVVVTISHREVCLEAQRCLQCGTYCYEQHLPPTKRKRMERDGIRTKRFFSECKSTGRSVPVRVDYVEADKIN